MKKEYKTDVLRAGYILAMIFAPCFLAVTVYGLYSVTARSGYWVFVLFGIFFFLLGIGYNYVVFFVFNKLSIIINNDAITFKMPHFKKVFRFEDICDIRRDFFNGDVGYNIYYKDKKGKKKHVTFNQDTSDSEELIRLLQKKSGVKMKNYGDLTIKETDSKNLIFFKKSYNIILTILIIFLFFVLPLILSARHRKTRVIDNNKTYQKIEKSENKLNQIETKNR